MTEDMAKIGRPLKYGKAPLGKMIRVRVRREEEISWKREAKRVDKSVSEWLRDLANESIKNSAEPKLHAILPKTPPPV